MKTILAATLALGLMAPAAHAQDEPEARGFDLMEEGARMILEGLLAELDPAWQELNELLANLNRYQPPEILPNGDIIIRRKPEFALEPEEEGETEL